MVGTRRGAGSAKGANVDVGGWDVDFHAVVKLERGGIALGIKSLFCRVLHVLSVSMGIAVEGSDGDANGSSNKCR